MLGPPTLLTDMTPTFLSLLASSVSTRPRACRWPSNRPQCRPTPPQLNAFALGAPCSSLSRSLHRGHTSVSSGAVARLQRGQAPAAVGNGEACDSTPSSELGCRFTCADMMTSGEIIVVHPETPVDDALEKIAENRITGMPVVDQHSGKLVGVVSDFDLLSLDSVIGKADKTGDIFPANGESWLAFRSVKKLLDKQAGKTVGDVMTYQPVVVHPETCLEDAARLLLLENIRRLPVLDDSGNIVGVISRSDIIKAALRFRRAKLN